MNTNNNRSNYLDKKTDLVIAKMLNIKYEFVDRTLFRVAFNSISLSEEDKMRIIEKMQEIGALIRKKKLGLKGGYEISSFVVCQDKIEEKIERIRLFIRQYIRNNV